MPQQDPIKIAIVGLGSRGRFLGEAIQGDSRYRLTALIDTDPDNLRGGRDYLHSSAAAYNSLPQALQEGDFEAVAVTTPDFTHEAVTVACFEAGRHVLCEKPLEITAKGCENILAAWQASGRILLIGFVLRYVRKLRKMHDLIAAGEIGRPVMVYANHEVPEGSRWYFHDWHALRRCSTGLLLQKGSHDIDILNWFMDATPVRVAASGGLNVMGGTESDELTCGHCARSGSCPDCTTHIDHFPDLSKPISCVHRRSVDVEDNHLVIIEYGNGTRASYSECHFSSYPRRSFCVIGDQGRIETADDNKIHLTRRFPADSVVYDCLPAEGGHDGGDRLMLDDFFRAITENAPTLADGFAGKISVLTAIAAHRSMREHRMVEITEIEAETEHVDSLQSAAV